MDGAKLTTDTIGYSKEYAVGRLSFRVEVSSQEDVDLMEKIILVVVGA